MFLYLFLLVVVVGAIAVVAVACKRLCHPKNTSGSPVSTEMNLNADAGGMTHQIHEDPPTAPVNNAGVSEDDGTGGAVKEEGVILKGAAIRCACSAHGSGGCVTFAEVS